MPSPEFLGRQCFLRSTNGERVVIFLLTLFPIETGQVLKPPAAACSEPRPGAHRESTIVKGETEAVSD
jgi:hypothetical protein